jgi:hypothetical protein
MDGSIFTFEDAFEDLLAVSQDQRLPDIANRYQQRQLLRSMFPAGEPVWFWLRRLESQGLLQIASRAKFFRAYQPDWINFHEELDRRAADAWRSVRDAHRSDGLGSGDLLEELGKAFQQLERGFMGERTGTPDVTHQGKVDEENGPDTFEELFSEISSKFKESRSSWDTFLKTITDDAKAKSPGGKYDAQADSHDKNKIVTDEEEYVDRFGYLHKTVTRKTLDPNGKEVGVETYVTIRPADKHLDNEDKNESDGHEPLENESDNRKSSWFWK